MEDQKVESEMIKEEEQNKIVPRDYQIEILEEARKRNTIACLGTGTGKTFIAVLLIREMAHLVQLPYREGGQRIFFLVPTVPLVAQQAKFIQTHTELKVKGYYGEMNVDAWDYDIWLKEFKEQQVLVMTGEICRIILHHSFMLVSDICLIILDECHQARGNSPYSKVMEKIITSEVSEQPRIFGLSASLINDKCKPQNLENELLELESTLQSAIVTANDYTDVLKYATDAETSTILYYSKAHSSEFSPIIAEMNRVFAALRQKGATQKDNKRGFFDFCEDVVYKPEQCICHVINILDNLGQWCAYTAACTLYEGLKKSQFQVNDDYKEDFVKVGNVLKDFINVCENTGADTFVNCLCNLPNKLLKLMDILRSLKKRSEKLKKLDQINNLKNARMDVTFESDPYLYAQNSKEPESRSNLCGIIFVTQRITAYVLCEWLKKLCEVKPEFEFVKPDYIFGQSMSRYELSKNFLMSASKQKEIIDRFRKEEFNILIATSVLEEGLDVQKCNFVIRFDFPMNFRAYMQSKGRARARNSVYILLLADIEREQIFRDLVHYISIEQMLTKICNDREVPLCPDADGDSVPPYMPVTAKGSPRITMSAAVSLLHRYCALLPCDMSMRLKPYFEIKEVDPDANLKSFICTVYLPINSSLYEPVMGPVMRGKKTAKMAAALETCKKLHEIGELDDHLIPVGRCVDVAAEELGVLEKEETFGSGKPGTNKRKQCYNKKVATDLKNSLPAPGVPCYLHVLILDLVTPLPLCLNPRKRPIINPADTVETFGLLLTKKLPNVCKFPIFTKCGKILIDIKCIEKSLTYDEKSLLHITKFHDFVFKDTLWLPNDNIKFDPNIAEFGCYVVPVNKDREQNFCVHMNFIHKTLTHEYNIEKEMTFEKIDRKKFGADDFKDAVLTKSYKISTWKSKIPDFYYITQIRHDRSPKTRMDEMIEMSSEGKTHEFHYKDKYDIDILDDKQPLLDVHKNGVLNKSKPIYNSVKQVFKKNENNISGSKKSHQSFREYLVPELCLIHPFPDFIFRKATYIPTILYRLNSLLIADEIRLQITEAVHVGMVSLPDNFNWPTFHLETTDKELHEYLVSEGHINAENYGFPKESADIVKRHDGGIESFQAKVDLCNHPGPSPSLLLQALTTKNVNDEFNLERLEMIGDSFLKYASSVKLFSAYPKFDEGKLTSLRVRFIQNLNLYQLAKKKNLSQCIFNTPFFCNNPRKEEKISRDKNLQTNWLPPCYVVRTENHKIRKVLYEDDGIMANGGAENDKQLKCQKKQKLELHERSFTQQIISDKCIADSVEALIGAYLLSCGQQGALRFMYWIGVNPFMKPEDGSSETNFENWPPVPPEPLRKERSQVRDIRNLFYFTQFEERIGYKFKQPAYLLQAFTHASCGITFNDVTDCYQRLEFLGDAVLDYLVTRTLYEDPKEHSPGQLTDLRTALVNNAFFASLAVKYGFHKNLKCLSMTLLKLVNQYVEMVESSEAFKHFEEFGYYLEEIECLDIDQVEIPKALGDVFESVAGAIYLDSGSSLDQVWKIYYPMMKPAIDHLCSHVPKSPVRVLYELSKDQDILKRVTVQDDKTYVHVQFRGKEFIGVGPNKKVAKRSAAKMALASIKKKINTNH